MKSRDSSSFAAHQAAELVRRPVTLLGHIIDSLVRLGNATHALKIAFENILILSAAFAFLSHVFGIFRYAFSKLKPTENRALNIVWAALGALLSVGLMITLF